MVSSLPLAMSALFGQATSALTCSWCCGDGVSRIRLPGRLVSQSQTDLSAPAAASQRPSGVNVTAMTF